MLRLSFPPSAIAARTSFQLSQNIRALDRWTTALAGEQNFFCLMSPTNNVNYAAADV